MQVVFEPRCRFKRAGVYWPGITYKSYKEAFEQIEKQNKKRKVDHAVIEISIKNGATIAEVFYDIQNKTKTLKPYHVETYHLLGKSYDIEENEADSIHTHEFMFNLTDR